MTRCIVLLAPFLFLSSLCCGEELSYDTVARLGMAAGFSRLTTLEQPINAVIISQPALILTPSFEFSAAPIWLFTMDSQFQIMKWDSPSLATLTQDPTVLSSVTAGLHMRSRVFELGFIGGVGQNAYIAESPTLSKVSIQNITLPFIGGKLAYNGRWSKRFFVRLEGSYERDLPVSQYRSGLEVTQNTRIRLQTQIGLGGIGSTFRFTFGAVIQNSQTSLGLQNNVSLQFGISVGNLWGQRVPSSQ